MRSPRSVSIRNGLSERETLTPSCVKAAEMSPAAEMRLISAIESNESDNRPGELSASIVEDFIIMRASPRSFRDPSSNRPRQDFRFALKAMSAPRTEPNDD